MRDVLEYSFKCRGLQLARLVVLFSIVLCGNLLSLSAQEPESDEYATALQEARRLSAKGENKAAIRTYVAANKLAGGSSVHCLLAMSILQNAVGDHDSAAANARRVVGLTEEPHALQRAYRELGVAEGLCARAARVAKGKAARKHLDEAEAAFRKALKLRPDDGEIHYLLAATLADQMVTWEQWSLHDEIKSLSARYLELQPTGPQADWARKASCKTYETHSPVGKRFLTGERRSELSPFVIESGENAGREIIPPVKVFSPPPKYTQWARRAKIQGQVIVETIVDKEGKVWGAKILQGLPLCLSEEAAAALKTWKFKPALLEGEPVDVYYNLAVNFKLKK